MPDCADSDSDEPGFASTAMVTSLPARSPMLRSNERMRSSNIAWLAAGTSAPTGGAAQTARMSDAPASARRSVFDCEGRILLSSLLDRGAGGAGHAIVQRPVDELLVFDLPVHEPLDDVPDRVEVHRAGGAGVVDGAACRDHADGLGELAGPRPDDGAGRIVDGAERVADLHAGDLGRVGELVLRHRR